MKLFIPISFYKEEDEGWNETVLKVYEYLHNDEILGTDYTDFTVLANGSREIRVIRA